MLEEFRALGGIAENVKLGTGPNGRGLFVIDPSREARVWTPPHMLIPTDDIVLDNGRMSIRPEANVDPNLRSFFERFEQHFSFNTGGGEMCRDLLTARRQLPPIVQEYILAIESPGSNRFPVPTDELVLRRFINTRLVGDVDRSVLMLLPELINHSGDHALFEIGEKLGNGVGVRGRFADEVLACYSRDDSWQKFVKMGFVCTEPLAYAIPLECRSHSGLHVRVLRNHEEVTKVDGMSGPKIERQCETLVISHVVLGHRRAPGLPKALFLRAMRDQALADPLELFDAVAHITRSWFHGLLAILDDHDGPLIREMRRAARVQLDTLSFSIGANADFARPQPAAPDGRMEASRAGR
jgi:hypothetical protein